MGHGVLFMGMARHRTDACGIWIQLVAMEPSDILIRLARFYKHRITLVTVKYFAVAAALLTVSIAQSALLIMPLKDVRAGMHGVGKTVFGGDKIEDFQVEILGILPNTGPKENIILGRLSGGPL